MDRYRKGLRRVFKLKHPAGLAKKHSLLFQREGSGLDQKSARQAKASSLLHEKRPKDFYFVRFNPTAWFPEILAPNPGPEILAPKSWRVGTKPATARAKISKKKTACVLWRDVSAAVAIATPKPCTTVRLFVPRIYPGASEPDLAAFSRQDGFAWFSKTRDFAYW